MREFAPVFLELCLDIGLVLMLLALALSVVRVWRGPTSADRVVAIDLFGTLCVAFITLLALHLGRAVYLDAAIALALVAFFGSVAYARFLERRVADAKPTGDGNG